MAHTLNVGNIRCHIVSDGVHPVDGGGFFGLVPRVLWQRVVEPNELNQVPSDTRCLLIESAAGPILVDTGHGDKYSARQRQIIGLDERRGRLLADMARVGIRPEDVALVLLTHLHADHAGGATRWDTPDHSQGAVVPTFPNARYLVQRLDLAEASFPNERTAATYHAENWQILLERGQLEVIDGPRELAPGDRTDIAPGHTASIQVVWVEDQGESLLFLGDACSWAVHLERLAWVPSFDLDPMTSIETKRRLRHEAMRRDALLVFQHDGQVVTGRLAPGGRGPEVRPEITQAPWSDWTRD
jgi:glyoxylase-like metal-dependent hydrolase (beta-lactamase superfamily II)